MAATNKSELEEVMGVLSKKLKGKNDVGKVSTLVKEKLINQNLLQKPAKCNLL